MEQPHLPGIQNPTWPALRCRSIINLPSLRKSRLLTLSHCSLASGDDMKLRGSGTSFSASKTAGAHGADLYLTRCPGALEHMLSKECLQ